MSRDKQFDLCLGEKTKEKSKVCSLKRDENRHRCLPPEDSRKIMDGRFPIAPLVAKACPRLFSVPYGMEG